MKILRKLTGKKNIVITGMDEDYNDDYLIEEMFRIWDVDLDTMIYARNQLD